MLSDERKFETNLPHNIHATVQKHARELLRVLKHTFSSTPVDVPYEMAIMMESLAKIFADNEYDDTAKNENLLYFFI